MTLAMWRRRVRFYLGHPARIAARLKYLAWERLNPDKPWLTPGAVHYCELNLRKDMVAIEWGSGRSTAWLAKQVGKLVSVEHDRHWYERVREEIGVAPNIDFRYVALDHPEQQECVRDYPEVPKYVAVVNEFPDESIDFAAVDGHYRPACIKALERKLKPGGLMLLDDVNMLPLERWFIPKEWALVSHTTNGLKTTGIWRRPH